MLENQDLPTPGAHERADAGASSRPRSAGRILAVSLLLTTTSCASIRSEIRGRFESSAPKAQAGGPVDVCFVFRHFTRTHGFDATPKLVNVEGTPGPWSSFGARVTDFEDLFSDALTEFRNLENYATFTDLPADAANPERLSLKQALADDADYVIEISFLRESSFAAQFFAGSVSVLSLTVIPVYFGWDYTMTVDVHDHGGALVGTYSRGARLHDWVQTFLIFVYPFHPRERKLEEIYVECLHDAFRQIDAEGILVPPAAGLQGS